MEEMICEVRWDEIRVSPFQPRRHFHEGDLEELAHSILSVGLIQPPVVRKIMSGGRLLYYELIAGERRWRASKIAGNETIKVIVREISDGQAAKTSLIENIQRVDLDPMEVAQSLQKLIDAFGMKQQQIAQEVGKKRSTVANYLRLLSLSPSVRESLSRGAITMGHAKVILSLESQEFREALHDKIIRNKLTVRQAEQECARLSKKSAKDPIQDLHVKSMQEDLEKRLGTKVSIDISSEGKGKIAIHTFHLDDLERIFRLLTA